MVVFRKAISAAADSGASSGCGWQTAGIPTIDKDFIAQMNRFLKKFRLPVAACVAMVSVWTGFSEAALITLHRAGVWIHCPETERVLAARLYRSLPAMKSFLEKMGLALPEKIHVVLVAGRLKAGCQTEIIPLYRIRIALQPPGPLEDGAVEPDPWSYRLFMGLAREAVFYTCRGIPAAGRKLMGAVISPNRVLPAWVTDGVCHLLWELHRGRPGALSVSALDRAVRNTAAWPGLDKISNHPRIWPGPESPRIWGRPFVRWIYRVYGWSPLLDFIRAHGGGVIPFEVDLKAEKTFGLGWDQLWTAFSARAGQGDLTPATEGLPGAGDLRQAAVGAAGPLVPPAADSVAAVRVVYKGSRPFIAFAGNSDAGARKPVSGPCPVEAPQQVTALDGPVTGPGGRIAVAGCAGGNWDIWAYDGTWKKIVTAAGTQCHPAFGPHGLVFASDHDGTFRIYDPDWHLLSTCHTAALRPCGSHCYCLRAEGWSRSQLKAAGDRRPPAKREAGGKTPSSAGSDGLPDVRPYRPFSGMWPNYLAPDVFLDSNNVQLGLATRAEDACGKAGWDAGVRYAFSQQYTAWQLAGVLKPWSGRLTSYPLDYETDTGQAVAEARKEACLSWRISRELVVSLNGRRYGPLYDSRQSSDHENEYWLACKWSRDTEWLKTWLQLEIIESRGPSLSGWLQWRPGKQKRWEISLYGGKSWGPVLAGHNSFRIGGDVPEGFFTRRTTRLFPVRGFAPNCLEAGQAFTGRAEFYLPLARIHRGHGTFPVFWRSLKAGFFVDCGLAAQRPAADRVLVGTGMELIASFELAWEIDANLHLGVAWPVARPGFPDRQEPVLLLQIGRPL